MPLTDAGFVVESANERLLRMQADFEERSGKSPNWDDAEEFVAIMLQVLNAELQTEAEALQAVWDAYSPNNATGRANQNLAALALLEPIPASPSRVVLTVAGTSGVVIPAGKIVRHSGTKTRWRILEDIEITPGAQVIAQSVDSGPIPAAPDTLTEIVTPVAGWTGVTNFEQATLGRSDETDAQLRIRRTAALGNTSYGTVPAISQAVLNVDGITGVRVVANNTDADLTVGAFTVAPTRILVMVLPDPLTTDEKADLADALQRTLPAGNKSIGDEACSTTVDGVTYSFLFAYADIVTINIEVNTTLKPGYALEDVEDAIGETIAEYFSELQIGGDVGRLPLYGRLADIEGVLTAALLIDGVDADYSVADSQIAQLGTVTVT